MVTTIAPRPSFEVYHGIQPAADIVKTNSSEINTMAIIFGVGMAITSAATIYFIIQNNDLRKKLKYLPANVPV